MARSAILSEALAARRPLLQSTYTVVLAGGRGIRLLVTRAMLGQRSGD